MGVATARIISPETERKYSGHIMVSSVIVILIRSLEIYSTNSQGNCFVYRKGTIVKPAQIRIDDVDGKN